MESLVYFVRNKSFGQLLDISSTTFYVIKTFNLEFSYIEVWFTDQNSKPIEIEEKINIILVLIKAHIKVTHYSVQPRDRIFVK